MKKILIMLALGLSLLGAMTTSFMVDNKRVSMVDSTGVDSLLPASVRTFDLVQKYSAIYEIPQNIAFGLLHVESNYQGIAQLDYNPAVSSPHKAYGACQIKVGTANMVSDTRVTKHDLLNNLELNIQLAFKLLSGLKKSYGSWALALGAYNTGKPVHNKYATKIIKFNVNKIYTWTPVNKG